MRICASSSTRLYIRNKGLFSRRLFPKWIEDSYTIGIERRKSPHAASTAKLVSQVAVILKSCEFVKNHVDRIFKKRTDTREDTNSGGGGNRMKERKKLGHANNYFSQKSEMMDSLNHRNSVVLKPTNDSRYIFFSWWGLWRNLGGV